MQFVFTTHSPIVASSVESQNIFVMEPDPLDGSALVVQYHQEIYGKTAEQVLLSSFFGLDSTRPASFVESLEPLSNKAIKGDRDAAVAMMEKLAEPVEIDKSKFDGLLN
jgi:predicted ATP-binding protein involved in virulence